MSVANIQGCYECTLCKSICPSNAIGFVEKGWASVPKIDENKCVECNLCERFCLKLNSKLEKECEIQLDKCKAWAFFLNDEKSRYKCSSGGFFYAMATAYISNNDYVCGGVLDENCNAIHIVSNNMDDVYHMIGSKYLHSDLNGCFTKIKDIIATGHRVLFSGTGCQCKALDRYLREKSCRDKAIIIAVICHGVPIQLAWEKYREKLEKKYKSKLVDVQFKSKVNRGWQIPYCRYTFSNGVTKYWPTYQVDEFVQMLMWNYSLSPQCTRCECKGNQYKADFVIGDCWNASEELKKKANNTGISCVIATSNEAEYIFKSIAEKTGYSEEINTVDFLHSNGPAVKAEKYNDKSRAFINSLQKNGWNKAFISHAPIVKVYGKKLAFKLGYWN